MRVAIDTSASADGHKHRGTGVYTGLLIQSLQRYESNHSYTFFVRGEKIPNTVDLVHYPYFDPFFLTLPLVKRVPSIVTVHDLIPLVFPDKFPRGIRGEVKWQVQKLSLQRTKAIITDSENSKQDITRIVGFPQKDIFVVPLAPGPHFRRKKEKALLSKYHLTQPYLLYVGDVNWNKNIIGMLSAYAQFLPLRRDDRLLPTLVLAGDAFLDTSLPEVKKINACIAKLHIEGNVKKIGFVPDHELPVFYSHALTTVLPSFCEGFGLPLLEAMGCGCPVVCSGNSSLMEIAGPAILVNPYDDKDILRGIVRIQSLTKKAYQQLSEKSAHWAKQYSWESVAEKTMTVYENVVAHI